MAVSPLCEVKDGAGAYQATTNGVNVTPTNTVTIHLIDTSADVWSISCVYTDETSDAATVTAALTIDPVARTATFTAPAAGKTYIFQSKVNNGVANGRSVSSYTTTFGIYTLTAGGDRVLAANETMEGDATFGWIAVLNGIIRAGGGGGGGATPNGVNNDILTSDGAGDFGTPITPAAGIATFLATPSSANLRSALTDETGTGAAVFASSPTIASPSVTSAINLESAGGTGFFYQILPGTIAADRNATLPALTGNDEFVFAAHAQTLTNKTLTTPVLDTPSMTDAGFDIESTTPGNFYTILPGALAANREVSLPTITGNDTFALIGASQTLSNKTVASPTITGAITISSFTSATTTSADGKVTIVDATVSAQTTNATPAVAYSSSTLTDEAVHLIDVVVTAIKSDGSAAAMYKRSYAGRRDGGTWTQLAAVGDKGTEETTSAWDCTVGVEVATNVFEVTVTGEAATTIRWGVSVRIQSTVP